MDDWIKQVDAEASEMMKPKSDILVNRPQDKNYK